MSGENSFEKDIQERLEKLHTGHARNYFLTHPDYPANCRAMDEAEIIRLSEIANGTLPPINNLIRGIRKKFGLITEQTNISAAYFLLGKAYSNLETILFLAPKGKHLEIVDLIRSAQESLDLVFLFLEDESKELLEKWFKGETIPNREARRVLDNVMNRELVSQGNTPAGDMKGFLYNLYSKYTHSSYAAILDAVDVFHEDFDFEGTSGFYYTRENFQNINNLVASLLIQLKNFFVKFHDQENFRKVDKLYKSLKSIEV